MSCERLETTKESELVPSCSSTRGSRPAFLHSFAAPTGTIRNRSGAATAPEMDCSSDGTCFARFSNVVERLRPAFFDQPYDSVGSMSLPAYQSFWFRLTFLIAGVLFLGNVLNALVNAFQFITPSVTYSCTALIALGWIATQAYLHRGRTWVIGGQTVRLKRLGPNPLWFVFGLVLLLWYPRAVDFVKLKRVELQQQSAEPTVDFHKIQQ